MKADVPFESVCCQIMNICSVKLRDSRDLLVRLAKPDDAAALLEYLDRVSRETDFMSFGPGEFNKTIEEEVEFIEKHSHEDNRLLLVAIVEEQIVGCLSFSCGSYSRCRHSGELGITVKRDFWGLDIGSRMMDALVDWGRASNVVTKLNLRVRTDNERAINLYRNKGFVVEGTIRKEFFHDGKYYDHYWMGMEV